MGRYEGYFYATGKGEKGFFGEEGDKMSDFAGLGPVWVLVGGATHACVGGRGASRPVSAHSTQHTVHCTLGPWKLEVGSWKSP